MSKVLVGVVSATDFERARDYISELSNYRDYDDWLDSRYGRFMGLSIGGAEASFETVALDDFLDWCGVRRLRPSETALDACAKHFRPGSRQEPLFGRLERLSDGTHKFGPRILAKPPRRKGCFTGPNRDSLSAGSDL
jgi:hypothetical protein